MQNRYTWEAEKENGEIIREGGDLTGCIRVSLAPNIPYLPRHDLTGVLLINRFGRGFVKGLGGGLRDYVHCIVCAGFRFYVRASDGGVIITPQDYELYL